MEVKARVSMASPTIPGSCPLMIVLPTGLVEVKSTVVVCEAVTI